MNTWDAVEVRRGSQSVRVTSLPGRHGPMLVTPAMPSVMGSMLEFRAQAAAAPYRIYVSGDTLVYSDLKQIPRRYPDIDLALLHLGGTRVLGILVTMDAQQGIAAMRIIHPETTIPIHYNDYGVFKSPLDDFMAAVRDAGLTDRVRYLSHGDTFTFVPAFAETAS
jgi:L-ascorbate metabolism protein UlaG (beta-lactamase superfamily)